MSGIWRYGNHIGALVSFCKLVVSSGAGLSQFFKLIGIDLFHGEP